MKVLSFLLLAVLVVLCSCQPPQVSNDDQNQNDYKTLNYALTLEHLEAAYYEQGLQRFNESDFQAAGYPASVRSYINLIRLHEESHANLLTSVLNLNGATAVRACTYNFTSAFASVQTFLATARLLETTGTMAYDGAANTINNANYLQVAATIATVEARHSAFLNELNNQTAFPAAFETALSPAAVIAAASQFIVSCPDQIQLPVFAFEFVPLGNNTYFNRSGQQEDSEQIENDNDLLNYALTLELFGGAFYNMAANFTQQDFTNAGFGDVYMYFQMIISHENAHATFLRQTLQARGAAVAQPCTYYFGNALNSVSNALQFARTLENLEVTAYDGAINTITDYQLIQGAATIATVEARHAQYLNNVLLRIAVNNESLDSANTPAQILNITAPFFGPDCVAPTIPQLAYTLQAQNAQVAPTPSPVPVPSPSPAQPTPSPSRTPSPTTCNTPTPSPSSSCGCSGGSNNNDEGNVVINFYFADMLRGL